MNFANEIQAKRIFTFWEPAKSMPAYVKLCIETWRTFLPDYEVVIVDYSTLDKWLSKGFFDEILYSDFSLPKQADAIRAGILYRHGGIWLDADTIITSSDIRKIFDIEADFVMINAHLAFIKAAMGGGHSYILSHWVSRIKQRLRFYRVSRILCRFINDEKYLITKKLMAKIKNWDFLGNAILNKYLQTKYGYFKIDRDEINALPETKYNGDLQNLVENYQSFYFNNDFSAQVMKETKGIILLHNSWTPRKFLVMNEREFLEQNNTLSSILKTILQKES